VEHTAARQVAVAQASGEPAAEQALVVERLGKRFGDPKGAGKTTMTRTPGTLLTPASGYAAVAGLALSPRNGLEIRGQGEQRCRRL
jgi:ABC-type Na+ transport system ATPase subunit NatA